MSNLYVYCEGHTEKIFVEKLLAPFFLTKGIFVHTILAGDGRLGKNGGIAQYHQLKRELIRICREHSHEYVTTLIDYSPVIDLQLEYEDSGSVYDVVRSKENAIERDIHLPNLMINFELHEFEAYLYCSPEAFESYGRKAPQTISKIVEKAGGPEMINTNPNTLPSRRLNNVIPKYTDSKTYHTTKLLEMMTLDQINSKCKHFSDWLQKVCSTCKMNDF